MNWLPQLPAMDQSMEITTLTSSAAWCQDHRIREYLIWKGPTRKIKSNSLQAAGKPKLIFGKKPHHCGFKGHSVFWREVGWPLSLSVRAGHVRWVFGFGTVWKQPPMAPFTTEFTEVAQFTQQSEIPSVGDKNLTRCYSTPQMFSYRDVRLPNFILCTLL